jgi:hypothetical protein
MAKNDYQNISRQQRRLAQQFLEAHPKLKNTDITTLSTKEFDLIKAMHLKANGTDHILGPTEKQLERAEQFLEAHPELETTFEKLSDKEIGVIDVIYRDSQATVQAPEMVTKQSNTPTLEQQLQAEIAKRAQRRQKTADSQAIEQQPELSVQELIQQEAAKRRTAMGYDEEDTELEEERIVSSVENEPELSVQELMKQEAAKRRTAMGYDEEDTELEEERIVSSVENEPELSIQEQQQPSNLAQDSVIFGSENEPRLSVTVSEVVDPITQAIRDEIIKKQQLLLQAEIAKGMEEGSAKEAFQKQDLTALRAYLASEKGKEAVAQVMQNPEMQSQMHAIEQSGYKTVHSKFQDSFRNVDWGQLGANKIRTTNITNDAGEAVCKLKETTIDTAPTSLVLDNGTMIAVKSYRQIDFPKELETGNGPMHVSMALKDENGRNMPEKDAVYFTAHYDDSGKLTEVSSPVPVKFMGTGDDAIGYIERNGKVFTLPVTQGKYREMMQEVAKNHGMNVDISQSLETNQELAHDRVITPEQSVEQVTQAPKAKPVKPVANTPLSSSDMEQQLQAQKEKLRPVGDRELAPKPEQPESLEQQLQAQKKKLKPVEERVLAPKPEQSQEMTLLDELRSVASGRTHTNGNLVPSEVVQKVQTLRSSIEDNTPQSRVAKAQSRGVTVGTRKNSELSR